MTSMPTSWLARFIRYYGWAYGTSWTQQPIARNGSQI